MKPRLQVITPNATPEEVAAIVAAIAALEAERAAHAVAAAEHAAGGQVSEWVRASRLTARRGGMTRGPWRMSGRVKRRARA